MRRAILHVDMDAFYASVEQRDDPSLRGKPVVVGGSAKRGVVTAASYEARPFGVRSAMPMAEALRKCPQAIVLPVRMARYVEVSAAVFRIFKRYTPLVQGLSLDEAFLDVTASRSLFGEGEAVARAIQRAVRDELGLGCSAGVASCKFAAKIASDLRKPNGLVVVPDDVPGFLAKLPIERMWGVGAKAAPRLRAEGWTTIGDLARADGGRLRALLGSWGAEVQALARGIDDRPVDPDRVAKSVGAEETFEHDLVDRESLETALLSQSTRVAARLHESRLAARALVLKVKDSRFQSLTRRTTFATPVATTGELHAAARALLRRVPLEGVRVRLTGVSATDLVETTGQGDLFADPKKERGEAIEDVLARTREKFGDAGLTFAALVDTRRR